MGKSKTAKREKKKMSNDKETTPDDASEKEPCTCNAMTVPHHHTANGIEAHKPAAPEKETEADE